MEQHLPASGASHQSRTTITLLVRHFPSWLNKGEKESLLKHFGAQEVIVMGSKGKMRNCAFSTFANEGEAKWVINKLHQLDVFGHRLCVEYAQPSQKMLLQDSDTDNWACNKSQVSECVSIDEVVKQSKNEVGQPQEPLHISQSTIEPPRYLYPLPTPTILANISNALACVPQLYVQVLHLMNRMNLPPPFGELTPAPPLLLGESLDNKPVDYERSSEEEGSEMASDDDSIKKARPIQVARRVPKRRSVSYKQVKDLLPTIKKRRTEEEETAAPLMKKIELNIPSEIVPRKEVEAHTVTYIREEPLNIESKSTVATSTTDTVAVTQESTQTDSETDNEEGGLRSNEKFITVHELRANTISKKEMQEYAVFSKYSRGEPSMRLYIKNLGKHVEEKDLRYIYGRYVNWSSEKEVHAFDIRLMQSGRMKGQAFIGLPSEELATRALQDTNGYMLQDRPMVVQFGRSTKPKDKSEN